MPEKLESGRRAARQGMRILGLEERMRSRDERSQVQVDLVALTSWISPAVAFTYCLERVAGRDPGAAQVFRRAVAAAAAKRMELYVAASWSGKKLDAGDFERLVAASPKSVAPPPAKWWRELLMLGAWTLVLAAAAVWILPRSSAR